MRAKNMTPRGVRYLRHIVEERGNKMASVVLELLPMILIILGVRNQKLRR
jgi:hypothetical protein